MVELIISVFSSTLRTRWYLPFIDISQGLSVHYSQYIPGNMHTVFALLCFVVVIHWLIFQYPSGLLHWHCGNLMIAPVPAKQPWWIWINTSCEFIMNDCITTTKQSTTKLCAYFLGYTVYWYAYDLQSQSLVTWFSRESGTQQSVHFVQHSADFIWTVYPAMKWN